jgi:hypothetical protein
MMHYLAAYIARKRPEAASFVQELDFARSLCQVPIDLLLNEANVLRSWYNQVLSIRCPLLFPALLLHWQL